ncbi:GGDEF domain-containing protein [Sphingomonas lycopersici]|uniref:GGDEF domain-containing protein n=1 Tax=Sphingomonas lycopersici TaxID=2951807 RepID=UPI002238DB53|nr:GGDEF domain-containing protein [Sphingomonas lycopersici]
MEPTRTSSRQRLAIGKFWMRCAGDLPDPVYRDLVSTLFSMRAVIVGFGALYVIVGALIYSKWHDVGIAALTVSAIAVTVARVMLISAYDRAGGSAQPVAGLRRWERRYEILTYLFALLLAGINIRVLMEHEPLVHISTISLVFTFGAGIVSRNAGRPRLCVIALALSVVPTALTMFIHAASDYAEPLHAEFFIFEALLLLAVAGMSLGSIGHLYTVMVDHLTTKHDLAKLARFDALTGLPNRLSLRESFQSGLRSSQQATSQLAIHYMDLDGFKSINDRYGHPTGDKMLLEVARRLNAIVRADDVACRLGGDEFLLVQTCVQHRDQAEILARRVIRQLSEPYLIDGIEMRVTVSVGISLAPEFGVDLENLMACADAALYRSKARGKAQVQFCDAEDYRDAGRAVA